jgi:hypothetical protein
MNGYWYISENKLRSMGALDPGLRGRLSTKAKIGLGAASLEVGLDGATTQALGRAGVRAEKQLRREHNIHDVADFRNGPPPAVYFDSCGPASRAVIADVFWVAMIDGDVAVLLVGSAANAVGARAPATAQLLGAGTVDPMGSVLSLLGVARLLREQKRPKVPTVERDEIFSPSADPVGAALHLIGDPQKFTTTAEYATDADGEHTTDTLPNQETRRHVDALAYAWNVLMRRSLDPIGDDIDGLPRARTVSQYVARHHGENFGREWTAGATSLVLGTPIYVAQVT